MNKFNFRSTDKEDKEKRIVSRSVKIIAKKIERITNKQIVKKIERIMNEQREL